MRIRGPITGDRPILASELESDVNAALLTRCAHGIREKQRDGRRDQCAGEALGKKFTTKIFHSQSGPWAWADVVKSGPSDEQSQRHCGPAYTPGPWRLVLVGGRVDPTSVHPPAPLYCTYFVHPPLCRTQLGKVPAHSTTQLPERVSRAEQCDTSFLAAVFCNGHAEDQQRRTAIPLPMGQIKFPSRA